MGDTKYMVLSAMAGKKRGVARKTENGVVEAWNYRENKWIPAPSLEPAFDGFDDDYLPIDENKAMMYIEKSMKS